MVLVDTSVWIHHFRSGTARLRELLQAGEMATHPMVLGELACGNLTKRAETLRLLNRLPRILKRRSSGAAIDRVPPAVGQGRRLDGCTSADRIADLVRSNLDVGPALGRTRLKRRGPWGVID